MHAPEWEADLGKAPDRVVAEQAGIPQATVRARRKELGIPAFQQAPPGRAIFEPVPETPAPVKVSGSVVLRRRQGETARTERRQSSLPPEAVGAPVQSTPVPRVPWRELRAPSAVPLRRRSKMDPFIHLIGVRPDAEVAELAGVTRDNVRNFRKRQRIAPASRAEAVPVEGTSTHAPQVQGATRKKPGRPTPIDAYAHLLGTVPDAEVARQAGASVAAVGQYRARRKIAPYRGTVRAQEPGPVPAPPKPMVDPSSPVEAIDTQPATHAPRKKPGRPSPLDAFSHLIGTVPDRELAERSGASVEAVRLYRTYRRIPRFQEAALATHVPGTGAAEPAAVDPVVAPPGALAYKVIATSPAERRKFVVVADGILEATTLASRALLARPDGPWMLQKIKLLGDGLR